MKKSFITFLILTLAFQGETIAGTNNIGWRKSILLGYGITNTDQTQNVHLDNTPAPGLDNRYIGSSRLHSSNLLGLALEKEFTTPFQNTISTVGFEIDYLRNKSASGTVEPMVNVSPDFDILKYSYDIHSLVFQVTGQYTKQDILPYFDSYIQAGLGAAINRLSNYHEYAPGDSSAAPMLSPYGDRDTLSPAFSAGIGIAYHLKPYHAYVAFGYRYFCTGRGRLNKSPVQQTNSSIILSPINYQFLILSLTI